MTEAPGAFFFLVRDGVLAPELLSPVLARLPAEEYVRTEEAFDSKRWPVARDAALAEFVAARFGDPAVDQAMCELAGFSGDIERIRARFRTAMARMFRAQGVGPELFLQWTTKPTPSDLAVFDEPPWPAATAEIIASLCDAHLGAAEGLFAYHAYRGIPGRGAEAAARLARRALADGRITPEELVAAALDLVPGP